MGGSTGPEAPAPADQSRLTQRPEPITWDIYLLFLLRVLHELYGGDGTVIIAGMNPVDAMSIVADHYNCCGTPPTSTTDILKAQATILEIAAIIQVSSHASEPAYVCFLDTLRAMYVDVGGDPNDFMRAQKLVGKP